MYSTDDHEPSDIVRRVLGDVGIAAERERLARLRDAKAKRERVTRRAEAERVAAMVREFPELFGPVLVQILGPSIEAMIRASGQRRGA